MISGIILSRTKSDNLIQRFGDKLRTLRLRQGMTVRELTRALGYSGSGQVSEIETGKRLPTVEFVLKVARYFNVSADHLLKDELEVDDAEAPPESDAGS